MLVISLSKVFNTQTQHPTPKPNTKERKTDIQEFGRKLRLLEHFDDNLKEPDHSLIRNKSNFVQPKTTDKYLNIFLKAISYYHQQQTACTGNNITEQESKALEELKNDSSIIIKEADKRGATVIMDKTFYRTKIQELLSDTSNYVDLTDGNKDGTITRKIERLLKTFFSKVK